MPFKIGERKYHSTCKNCGCSIYQIFMGFDKPEYWEIEEHELSDCIRYINDRLLRIESRLD